MHTIYQTVSASLAIISVSCLFASISANEILSGAMTFLVPAIGAASLGGCVVVQLYCKNNRSTLIKEVREIFCAKSVAGFIIEIPFILIGILGLGALAYSIGSSGRTIAILCFIGLLIGIYVGESIARRILNYAWKRSGP